MAASIMDEYLDGPMDDDTPYQCKRCEQILEEGKAFELAGYRWHLDCFRCNNCETLLDSDANLLLLGDGSLICNNCTYSCSACGNKIEDLAILTGEQAFCATCFRCRNCKRKIENLRYARTSTGIFCMSCHESLMARRKKKAKAAQAAKAREKEHSNNSPMTTEKSLPALPPTLEHRHEHDHRHEHRHEHDADPSTELSPRPRQQYNAAESRANPDRSAESPNGGAQKNDVTLPSTTYGHNRASVMHDGSVDLDNFFTPMALDGPPTTALTAPPRPPAVSAPHIFFQEKGRMPSGVSESSSQVSQHTDNTSRGAGAAPVPAPVPALTRTMSRSGRDRSHFDNGASQSPSRSSPDEFKLQDAPKAKKTSPTSAQPDAGFGGLAKSSSSSSKTSNHTTSNANGTPRISQDDNVRADPNSKAITRKQVGSNSASVAPSSTKPTSLSRTASADAATHRLGYDETSLTQPTGMTKTYTHPRPAPAPPVRELSSSALPPGNSLPSLPPAPPVPGGASSGGQKQEMNGIDSSPKLPRWSSGAEFTLDEDMARILGTDEGSSSILRRVSNAVRHGRTNSTESSTIGAPPTRGSGHARSISETTRGVGGSPHWPKTPTKDSSSNPLANKIRDLTSPPSGIVSPDEDTDRLKRQLRSSELRVADLERQANTEKNLHTLTQKLMEKRKTVSELDTQTELMIREIEVLAGYVERVKQGSKPIDIRELEDTAIKEFVDRLEQVKRSMVDQIEKLHSERSLLLEEREQAVSDRDRALMEFEQLSSKNAQLADMNNDLTHQIQGRFKAQIGNDPKSPNGLGIYGASKFTGDGSSIHTGTTTLLGGDHEEPIVESGPMVVNIRKGQVRKFNWKKGSKTLAQNVGKGVSKAAAAFQAEGRDRHGAGGPLAGDNIGLPYNMTVAQVDAPVTVVNPNGRKDSNLDQKQGFGFFGKKGGVGGTGLNPNQLQMGKSISANNMSTASVAEAPSTLFGSDLTERADYERRQIPCVVTRCIEEVELRGMDIEGIYRKTGGNSQVKMVQDGFDKDENYDISDPIIDITAVTSVLKQYFRKLPVPLLTFDIYDRILESNAISNPQERCVHLRQTFHSMPQRHQDTLEFLMFHLSRVAKREPENLMSPKNLAVVFAPTIMRDLSIEREMSDMHAKNIAVQFVIENSETIFSE